MRRFLPILLVAGLALSAAWSADLPIKQVVLFSTGVGYFEHQGEVDGNAELVLAFRVEQINDILKSLVLQDRSGGSIAPVTYAPQDPLSRQLSAFSVNIGGNPSLAELLLSLKGAEVTIEGDRKVTGTILGVEERQQAAGQTAIAVKYVNLLTADGMVSIAIAGIKSVELSDKKLNEELKAALAAIAAARDVSKREVRLAFVGKGQREVSVGYLLESPVWKTTYRLSADEGATKAWLQGWAIVENTTDADWQGVALSLVAGRPISFIQNLYTPLYAQRPEVPVSLPTFVMPRKYGENLLEAEEELQDDRTAGGEQTARGRALTAAPSPPPAASRPGLAADGLALGGGFGGAAGRMELAKAGVASAAAGGDLGEMFQYAIQQPVSIPRQQSAMIPIVNQGLDAEKLSIYTQSVQAKHPLYGLRLKNTTGLHLMGGPITVFDGGAYAGDALLDDLGKDEDRLITYAVDLGVEVAPEQGATIEERLAAKLDQGVLIVSKRLDQSYTYTAKSRAQEERKLLIEHPIMAGWDLVEPAKPAETTRDMYRFALTLAPGKSEKLTVKQSRKIEERVVLWDPGSTDTVKFYLAQKVVSDKVKAALQEIVKRRVELAGVVSERTKREARIKEISDEQTRIRQNMQQLDRASDLYKRYVEKLNGQETEIESLQKEIDGFKAQEKALNESLNQYIRGLTLE